MCTRKYVMWTFIASLTGVKPLTSSVLPQQSSAVKDPAPIDELKILNVEELMNLEVSSISRKDELAAHAAAAIHVITEEDIRRSGSRNIPEALRLAPNLQAARVNSRSWAISARGFNAAFSNKLLVLID